MSVSPTAWSTMPGILANRVDLPRRKRVPAKRLSIYQKLDSDPQVTAHWPTHSIYLALAQLRLGDKAGYRDDL